MVRAHSRQSRPHHGAICPAGRPDPGTRPQDGRFCPGKTASPEHSAFRLLDSNGKNGFDDYLCTVIMQVE